MRVCAFVCACVSRYDGGRLVFAGAGGLHAPHRPAGSATVHTHRIVHVVTALTRGTRYGLFVESMQTHR